MSKLKGDVKIMYPKYYMYYEHPNDSCTLGRFGHQGSTENFYNFKMYSSFEDFFNVFMGKTNEKFLHIVESALKKID